MAYNICNRNDDLGGKYREESTLENYIDKIYS